MIHVGGGGKKACEGTGKQKPVWEDVGAGWIGGGQVQVETVFPGTVCSEREFLKQMMAL